MIRFNLNDDIESIYKKYKSDGWFTISLLDKSICNNIIERLDNVKNDMYIPNTKIQFGYGNLINDEINNYVTKHKFVLAA